MKKIVLILIVILIGANIHIDKELSTDQLPGMTKNVYVKNPI